MACHGSLLVLLYPQRGVCSVQALTVADVLTPKFGLTWRQPSPPHDPMPPTLGALWGAGAPCPSQAWPQPLPCSPPGSQLFTASRAARTLALSFLTA